MYGIVLLAALTATEKAPAHGWKHHKGYGVCYGTCYGVGYEGWPHTAGGWGLPYGGYFAGYGPGHGGCYWAHGNGGGYGGPLFSPAPTGYAPGDREREKESDRNKYKDAEKDKTKEKEDPEPKTQARARVSFELPKGATLYVDDTLIEKADERKDFRTPPLQKGQPYYYELRVELVRDGKKYVETKRVNLSAGDDLKADFSGVGTTTGVAVVDPR